MWACHHNYSFDIWCDVLNELTGIDVYHCLSSDAPLHLGLHSFKSILGKPTQRNRIYFMSLAVVSVFKFHLFPHISIPALIFL